MDFERKQMNTCCMLCAFLIAVVSTTESSMTGQSSILHEASNEAFYFKLKTKNGPIEWDTLQESWAHFQVRLCGSMCNGTNILLNRRVLWDNCFSFCYPCDCDVTCYLYGTCCPYIDPQTPLKREDFSHNRWFLGKLSDYEFVNANDDADKLSGYPEVQLGRAMKGRFRCVRATWPRKNSFYFMVATCPSSETNGRLRTLCESNGDDVEISVDFLTPMTDVRNGITFKNIYCVRCNDGAKNNLHQSQTNAEEEEEQTQDESVDVENPNSSYLNLSHWTMEFTCASFQNYYHIDSEDTFLQAVLNNTKNRSISLQQRCRVSLQLPTSLLWTPKSCPYQTYFEDSSDTDSGSESCPQADSRPVYQTLSDLCSTLNSHAIRYASKGNIFCYLCHDDAPECGGAYEFYSKDIRGIFDEYAIVYSPLTALFGYRSGVARLSGETTWNASVGHQCLNSLEWMDDQGQCRLPRCALGKRLEVSGATCETVVSSINGLRYKVFMVLTPYQPIPAYNLNSVREDVNSYFQYLAAANLSITYVLYSSVKPDEMMHIRYVTVNGAVQASPNLKRDNFERWLLGYSLESNTTNKSRLRFFNSSRILFGDETTLVILKEKFATKIFDFEFRWAVLREEQNDYSEANQTHSSTEPDYLYIVPTDLLPVSTRLDAEHGDVLDKGNDFIDMNPSLVCPFVEVDISAVNISEAGHVVISFFSRGKEHRFEVLGKESTFAIFKGKLRVCINSFRSLFEKIEQSPRSTAPPMAAYVTRYLTLLCLSVSVLCLVVTVGTYVLFPGLRTLPGLNLMTLSICLALAQLCLIVVSMVAGRIRGWPCQLLGIVLHYSWLASFHWMSVCCFHMFVVFNSDQVRRAIAEALKPFLKYALYAFGMPAIYMAVHITVSNVTSGGSVFGYSSEKCLFGTSSNYIAVILSFLLPLIIVVLSNGIFFAITVWKILSVRRMQASVRSTRSGDELFTYVKLSTLTGLSWIVILLAMLFGSLVLELISIPVVSLQGLFVFFSFTVNAKVKGLYLDLFGRRRREQRNSSTVSMTTNQRSSRDGRDDVHLHDTNSAK